MRGIYGRGDVLAGALILSVFVSLFTLTQVVRSTDDSTWSSVTSVNVERVGDLTPEIFSATPSVPCEDQEFSWKSRTSGWFSSIVTTNYTRCAVAMQDAYFETGSSAQGRIRSFSSKEKTFGLTFPALANVNVFAVPGSTSIMVNSWAYQNYYGGTSGLHIIRDYRLTMQDTGPDSAGNKIYAPAKPFDFELRGPDGKLIPIRTTGLKFSSNGQWMIFKLSYGGKWAWARLNLDTYEVFTFATPAQDHYAVYDAISNDGRYVALYEPMGNFRVYDLQKCSNGADRLLSQQCSFVELYPQLKAGLGANEVHFRNLTFKGDHAISLYAMTKKPGDTTWKFSEYSLRYGELPTSNGYLAMGDSFSSGEGAYDYRSQTDFYTNDTQYNLCHQSRSSYPYVLNKAIGFEWFGSVACSGAVTKDAHYGASKVDAYQRDNPQAKGLIDGDFDTGIYQNLLPGYREQKIFVEKRLPSVATLTIGGNDMGFGDIVAACVNPLYAQTCYESRDRREQLADLIDTLIPSLTTTYMKVKESAASPDFRLYVIGYPQVVSSEGECALNVGMDHYEREFAQRLVDYLNDAIRVAATKAGARYVNVSSAFIEGERDYRLCGNQTNLAINGLVIRGTTSKKPGRPEYQESYHPNLLGHALLASKINQETQSLTQAVPPALPSMSVVKQDESLRRAFVGDDKQFIDIKKPGYGNDLAQGPATRGESLGYKSSSSWPVAGSNSKAVIELHSTPIKLGEASFDAEGKLTGSVTIPADVEPGYHELHVKYNDFFGDSVDRYQIIFVRASKEDYDGDNIPNNTDPCVMSDQSGVDSDKDGIDDACDDEYIARASAGDGGAQTENEDVTRVTESIAVLAAQPQSTNTARVGDEQENTADGEEVGAESYVLDESIDVQTSATEDSVGGYAKRKSININEVLIVLGVLTVVSTTTLLGSKLLARKEI